MAILEPMALWGRQDISREQMYRLIDAAPELLEALEWCINSRPTPDKPSDEYLKAVAVIAKAKSK